MSTVEEKTAPLLTCRGLNTRYQEAKVLHDISLDFHKGEFIALLGKNGAGKTTLLSSLVGLLPSASEKLDICGLNPLNASRAEIARRVSFVPQEHDDMFPFSVLEVVVMGRTAYLGPFGAPRDADYSLCRQVLNELYISHLAERIYTTLSGGEKQLVLLARALVQTHTMVFLDEPTNHLDYKNRYRILASLKMQCVKNDSCVVACLHDPNHANIFADRVILLGEGRILAQGTTGDVMTGETISRLYGLAVSSLGNSIEPCFSQPSFAGKVLLLIGASGEGKTTTLEKVIDANRELKIDGIVCPGTWKNNRRFSSTATRIATGEEAPLPEEHLKTVTDPLPSLQKARNSPTRLCRPSSTMPRTASSLTKSVPLNCGTAVQPPICLPCYRLKTPNTSGRFARQSSSMCAASGCWLNPSWWM